MMNSNDKGNLGYAMVIADVMKKGFFVFTPLADTTSVDMVIGNSEMELKRVQVKYRTPNEKGSLEIHTSTVINGKRKATDLNIIDYWAIYCPNTEKVYYVSSEFMCGRKMLSLRIDESRRVSSGVHLANDFTELKY